jgi:hypothetical protein
MIDTWFENIPVIGSLPPEEIAAKLREMGDEETATELENINTLEHQPTTYNRGLFQSKIWQATAHSFGYIPPNIESPQAIDIQSANNITPDNTLKNARIKITLDRLRVADYPGGGTHHILFDFYAQNQVAGCIEHLHFNSTYRVREGQQAAIVGYPIFIGLNVGTEGVAFKCFTVNIKNQEDEDALSFLESDVFKAGLKLAETAQPAIAPLSNMALGLTKAMAKRHKNVAVQEFYLGLDFSNITTRARLREGSYIAVQIPENKSRLWEWEDWLYDPKTGQIVNDYDRTQLIPYNYIIFSVSRYS